MPLYEFECETCGHRFEAIRKFADPLPEGCPKCGGAVQKLQSAPAFQFKGSGWYITDYARKGEAASTTDSAGATKDDGGSTKDGAKTEPKEAAKRDKSEKSEKPEKSDKTSAESPSAKKSLAAS